MRKLQLSILTVLIVPFLAGCGLVAAFIPPIELGDVMSLDGQHYVATFEGGAEAAAQSTHSGRASAQGEQTLDDTDIDLRGFSLAKLRMQVGLSDTLRLAPVQALESLDEDELARLAEEYGLEELLKGGALPGLGEVDGLAVLPDFPERITIEAVNVEVTISDSSNGSVSLSARSDLDLTFERGECESAVACSYRYVGAATDLEGVIELSETDRRKLREFVDIIRLNGSPTKNDVTFSMSVEATADTPLGGFTLAFGLTGGNTVIELGG